MDDITRVCRKCGQEKPLEEFAKNKTSALGRKHICKQCNTELVLKWRAANPERVRENDRKRRAANPEKYREQYRNRYLANPEKILRRNRKWQAENAEKRREYCRKWRAANLEKVRESNRKWSAANPEKVREFGRKRREELHDSHLRSHLKKCGLPITPETIDYKRIQLKLYREIKKQQTHERD